MKILSIIWEYCSTAAIMVDGVIVGSVSEERFSRRKNDDCYPRRAVEWLLESTGITPKDLDRVALAGENFDPKYILCHLHAYSVQDRLREQHEYWYPRMHQSRHLNYLDVFKDKLDVDQYPGRWDEVVAFLGRKYTTDEGNAFFQAFRRQVVSEHLGIDPGKVVFPHHHLCHGYYAYYASPVAKQDRVLILTADAWGDDMNASVSVAEKGETRRLSTSNNFILARLYRSMTLLLGMRPDDHEYKVMGLAAYAKPDQTQGPLKVFRDTMYVDGLGFNYHITPPDLYVYFRDRLEGYRFDAIAGALQRYTEEILVSWVRNCAKATGARRLCFGGGIAMNVKAMMEIAKLDELEEIFICPSPSDESLAIGACYVVMHDEAVQRGRDPREVLCPLDHAYLGPDLDHAEVRKAVEGLSGNGRYRISVNAGPERVAALLASGQLVGRCAGRSEFGARALGDRSILADPRRGEVVQSINEKVKNRDFWMPFAPTVLEERASDYLVNPKGLAAPYMTIAFETTEAGRRDLRAALHPADLTCRPQIVTPAANPAYHALLQAFQRATGVGGLLNTSFNMHGEPIVQTAQDAVDVYERSGLDALVLGEYFIEKRSRKGEGGKGAVA